MKIYFTNLPTGEKRKVQGTVFDFTKAKQIATNINNTNDIQIKYGKGIGLILKTLNLHL